MFVPPAFRVDDRTTLHALMTHHPFATLITVGDDGMEASHLPLLLDTSGDGYGTLIGHVSGGNAQRHAFRNDRQALAIFHGPDAYVSPRWYANSPAVPTWNYATVHAYGTPRAVDDQREATAIVDRLVARFDPQLPQPWSAHAPADFRDRMMAGIQAFRMPVTRLQGKYKLSQNRPPEDQAGVWNALAESDHPGDQALVALAREAGLAGGKARR